ncbi:IS982 family transposase [Candidatus Acetothermia bacterium]|nr:IS982 family transposase [Candidatus Acetothermia bacterium]
MNYVQLDTFLSILYAIVDDFYQISCLPLLGPKPGPAPQLADSEVLTLTLAQQLLGFETERAFLSFAAGNLRHLFPRLLDQSQFNRRARALVWALERIRRQALQELGACWERYRLVDTAPVPVMKLCRFSRTSLFLGEATVGYCASKKEYYAGFKLALLVTLDGVITAFDLVPAHTDERAAVEQLLNPAGHLVVLGDKGFIGQEWQADWHERRGHLILTPKRCNQKIQNPLALDRLMQRSRRLVETVIDQLKEHLCLERTHAKTLLGLWGRVGAKLAGHTLAVVLNRRFGGNLLALKGLVFGHG